MIPTNSKKKETIAAMIEMDLDEWTHMVASICTDALLDSNGS